MTDNQWQKSSLLIRLQLGATKDTQRKARLYAKALRRTTAKLKEECNANAP